ncbi:MAG: AI-2E family transporter, partial [Anaerolineales bacterium]
MTAPPDRKRPSAAESPPWQPHARLVAAILLLVIGLGLLLRLGRLLIPVILGFLLAYLLDPLVSGLSRILRIPRWLSVLLMYAVIVLVVGGLTAATGLIISQQFVGLVNDLGTLSAQLPDFLARLSEMTLVVGPYVIDLSTVINPLLGSVGSAVQPLLAQTGALLASLAGATASVVALFLVVMLFGYYLLLDLGGLDKYVMHFVPHAYQSDVQRLLKGTQQVWRAFIRGQLILGAVVGVLTGIALAAVGLRFALVLGLIAGILELVPTFGPIVAGVLAVLVALFQGTNSLGLTPGAFALVVVGVSFVIQQIENNLLVPRIIGGSLNLHPMVVLLGAIVGGTMAGILGVLLAAPVIATGRLWLGFLDRKTVGLETWTEDSEP